MSRTIKFRHPGSISIAALVACFGAIPLGTYRWFLAPILLVPLVVLFWGIRAGTDAGPDGVTIRALFGRRRLAWSQIQGFARMDRRVVAVLVGDRVATLPAVTPGDLPRLVAASGTPLAGTDRSEAGQTGADQPADSRAGADRAERGPTEVDQAEADQPAAGRAGVTRTETDQAEPGRSHTAGTASHQ